MLYIYSPVLWMMAVFFVGLIICLVLGQLNQRK
jgi:hypothetical protein